MAIELQGRCPSICYVRLQTCWRVDDMKKHEFYKQHRSKNIALGVNLLALVVLFYLITLVKFGGGS